MRISVEPSRQASDYAFHHRIRVRFAETDAMGIVHHSRYLLYLEEARVAYLRHIGRPYPEWRAAGINATVLEVHLRYVKALQFDDEFDVHVSLAEVRVMFEASRSSGGENTELHESVWTVATSLVALVTLFQVKTFQYSVLSQGMFDSVICEEVVQQPKFCQVAPPVARSAKLCATFRQYQTLFWPGSQSKRIAPVDGLLVLRSVGGLIRLEQPGDWNAADWLVAAVVVFHA